MPEVLFQTYIYRLVNKLVAKTLPWSQKRNAAGVAAFAAFNHFWQEVHVKRTRNPNLTAPFIDKETLQNFYKLELIQGVTPRGYTKKWHFSLQQISLGCYDP